MPKQKNSYCEQNNTSAIWQFLPFLHLQMGTTYSIHISNDSHDIQGYPTGFLQDLGLCREMV